MGASPMIYRLILTVALCAVATAAAAQVHGVDVEVNENKIVPTVDQLQTFLNPGDYVRDVLG